MLEVFLEFNLNDFPLEDNVKKFWTVKDNDGFEFFKDKSQLVLLSIGVGQMFDFDAYINGKYGRDILADFKTSTFLIEDKKAIINVKGESKILVKIKPIINRVDFL
jgi:hypothetical protein